MIEINGFIEERHNSKLLVYMSNGLTFKLHNIFSVAVRLENNACQISCQSDENCVSN